MNYNTLTVLLLLITISSCEKTNEDQIIDGEVTSCIRVMDASNSNPIKGADVYLQYPICDAGSLGPSCYSGHLYHTSDSLGLCCIEHDRNLLKSSGIGLDVKKAGYVYFCWRGFEMRPVLLPDTVYLDPAAYIQFYIKNIPPQATNDEIHVFYPWVECGGAYDIKYPGGGYIPIDVGSGFILYKGAYVDTTLTVPARAGSHDIRWMLFNIEIQIDTTLLEIIMRVRDTTYIEILY